MNEEMIENLRRSYDDDAERRENAGIEDWKRKERDTFLALVKEEGKVSLLEIGSGPGRDGLYFKGNGIEVTCIDLSPENIRLCKEKGLNACVMNVYDLPYPAESFDAVYAMNSLLHTPKPELPGTLEKIRTVISPGGLFYFGVYGGSDSEGYFEGDWATPKRYFSFYSDEKIRETVENIFDIVCFEVVNKNDIRDHFQSFTLRKPSLKDTSPPDG